MGFSHSLFRWKAELRYTSTLFYFQLCLNVNVSIMPRFLYSRERSHLCPLDRRLDRFQFRCGHCESTACTSPVAQEDESRIQRTKQMYVDLQTDVSERLFLLYSFALLPITCIRDNFTSIFVVY
jgi:hypothetical protein